LNPPSGQSIRENGESSLKHVAGGDQVFYHQKSDPNTLKRVRRGRDTKQKILEFIAESEPNGKTSGELVKATGLHRDSIRLTCNSLAEENLIVRSGGKLGKYHLVSKIFNEDPGLNAFLFGSTMTKKFYELTEYPTCVNNIFCNTKFCRDVWLSKDYDNPDELVDEIYIFEFALRLGAVIIYELMQSIRFNQLQVRSQGSNLMKNDLLIKYIENAVRPLLFIQIFRKLYPVGRRLDAESDSEPKSFLEIQHDKFDELQRIFKNTFPDLFESLEKIRTNQIPKQIEWRKHDFHQQLERMKQLEKEDPGHTKCKGELLPDIKTNIKGKRVQRCSKCSRWVEVRGMRSKLAKQRKER
jgi:hypothetical protein